jgi:hypothetical protein
MLIHDFGIWGATNLCTRKQNLGLGSGVKSQGLGFRIRIRV